MDSGGKKNMIFTSITILFFLLIGVAAVALGHFTKRHELFIFGVIVIFFMGLFMIQNGFSEKIGEEIVLNSSTVDNVTGSVTSVSFVYDTNQNLWTNGLGLLCVLIAAGLALTWVNDRKEEKKIKLEGVDL